MSGVLAALFGVIVLGWPRRHPVVPLGSATTGAVQESEVGASGLIRWVLARRSGRSVSADVDRLVMMLEGIGPAIAAGVAPAAAVATSALLAAGSINDARLRDDLKALAEAATAGEELSHRWRALHHDHAVPAFAGVARAWALSEQLGCGLSESLSAATELMREQVDRERRAAVATAGPRATMQLLSGLPLVGVGIAALIGVLPWQLYAGRLGLVVLGGGLLLLFAGRRMVHRMIRRACASAALS
ncbi:type II secretion system F family protein [Rudaeicoccus suwonensis]|uniref:Type II secretion system (T2SS) protein F n=1 Tax=Rudaeicoccus suwonensis TaxID=657409 RepID=A0A561E328_9MICO|nr:type II secretion system F family protein [Rudaeicoccus suwonensis]TWE10002.1 type II secretion system (T2SS) protein F [Rudaeicoccus suwonensis]